LISIHGAAIASSWAGKSNLGDVPQRRCKGGRIERGKSKRWAIRDKKPVGHGVGGKIGTAFSGGRSPVGSIHIGDFKDND